MSELKFKPVGNFVLIKPLAFRYDVQEQVRPVFDPNKSQEELLNEVTPTEVVKTKIKKTNQLAKVLSIGTLDPEKTPFKVGDTVVYPVNATHDMDLVKGTKLIYSHNVVGIWE